jgi:pimeloyl-ACP methyl ester carboxylesterase
MPKGSLTSPPGGAQARVRRGYFECRYGQLHVHAALPPGGGFEEGAPLLCLHDGEGSARIFTRFLAIAGKERSVYAADLPGFGESDAPALRPTIADYAAALGDFLDSMRLRDLTVLGLRLGSVLATELALTHAAQVSRLIMVSVPLLTDSERQLMPSRPAPAAPPGDFRPPDWQNWAVEAAAQYPLRARLTKLTQRLLVLRPRDELWEATERVREAVPAARLTELERPAAEMFIDAPQRVAELVREFLRS